jgi:hypothetical protein
MGYSGVFEDTFTPFGHGSLTVGGTQYGTEVTATAGSSGTYQEVESYTMHLPTNFNMIELEAYLQCAVATSAAGTALTKWQGSDDGTNWSDISAVTTSTAAASTSYVDQPAVYGICTTSTNFGMAKNPLYVRLVICPTSTAMTPSAKTKGTSYLIARYWLV